MRAVGRAMMACRNWGPVGILLWVVLMWPILIAILGMLVTLWMLYVVTFGWLIIIFRPQAVRVLY